jgi:hypothetical protein
VLPGDGAARRCAMPSGPAFPRSLPRRCVTRLRLRGLGRGRVRRRWWWRSRVRGPAGRGRTGWRSRRRWLSRWRTRWWRRWRRGRRRRRRRGIDHLLPAFPSRGRMLVDSGPASSVPRHLSSFSRTPAARISYIQWSTSCAELLQLPQTLREFDCPGRCYTPQ